MSKLKLTPQQHIAATATGDALLISAAAGSGKTMVLVQRIMNFICDEQTNADITDFLIITYTRAAAAELRSRMLSEINKRIAEDPLNKKLRRQAALCVKANISTIHSFCTEILRENAHVIDLSPDFRVADDTETVILKSEVLESVIDKKYENIDNDADFAALAALMTETRGDRKLTKAVLDAYEKLQSHPDPKSWIKSQMNLMELDGIDDISETVWGAELIEHAKRTVDYCIERMKAAYNEMLSYEDMLKAYGNSFETSILGMTALRASLDIGWDAALECCNVPFPTARISGYENFKAVRSKCKEMLEKEFSIFNGKSKELLDDMKYTASEARGLFSLLLDFDDAYKAEKSKDGIIDFSDQEHLALKLLYDFKNEKPSVLAKEISKRYREILVDEYQDVNAVQELIFSSVSDNNKNLFMVGDVKQSIYRFRMADPTIFLKKYFDYEEFDEEKSGPKKVILPQNFRSKKGILNAVNYIFKNLMSVQFGEMDYTEREFLRAGASYPADNEPCIEYDILEVDKTEVNDSVTAEAEFVARRIKEIVESKMQIFEGDALRDVEYKDVTILLRSIKGRAWKYAVELSKQGIPADIPATEDFFSTYEVSTVVSFLSVIDNPHQDIPLVTVLRSPVFRFSLDELAMLRAENRKCDLYDAVVNSSIRNVKCKKFLDELSYLRDMSSEMPVGKFIWMLYNRTGIVELLCASDGGEDRKDNLVLLAELATKFESNGFKGLLKFVIQLRSMMENNNQPSSADSGSGNGVKIMSIHKSKGLEFPVVILADTTHKFNLQDTTKPILFHSELGVGLYRRNREKRYKYPTVARAAVSRRITFESLSEELRVLYVALTRAKQKLVMVSTVKDAEKEFEKYWPSGEFPAAPAKLEGISTCAGWIITTMLTRSESNDVYKPAEAFYAMPDGERWNIKRVVYKPAEERRDTLCDVKVISADNDLTELIRQNLQFSYRFENSIELPSKLTATELKGRTVDFEIAENTKNEHKTYRKLRKPDFIRGEKPLTGSEKGTALHYVMQYIDYDKCGSTYDVSEELRRLVNKRFIDQKQADAVDPNSVIKFFESALGKRLKNSVDVRREFKFSILVPARKLLNNTAEDEILFQGVVDCYFEESDGITVIDFKTDKITDMNYSDKLSTYSIQIKAYAAALEKITGKKVNGAYLYYFDTDSAVEII